MIMSNLFASLFAQGAPESRTDAGVVAAHVNRTVAEARRDSKSDNEEHEDAKEPMANTAMYGN